MPIFMNESEPVALARRLGELEGAAYAAGLAACERTARAERLSRIALGGDEADLAAAGSRALRPREVVELESRLRELAQFHDAGGRKVAEVAGDGELGFTRRPGRPGRAG